MSRSPKISEIAKILAILRVEQGSYTYIDKISQTSSRDLALYYIREALRDYHSLMARGFSNPHARQLAGTVDFEGVEGEIERIRKLSGAVELREELSTIAAQALAEAAKALSLEEQERREEGATATG
uniref:Type I-A CRISPR-associated protein Csa5 n=1 Tax=Thermofilum pendens TaxID=2269 RepID=A0A7C4BAI3_THEPE